MRKTILSTRDEEVNAKVLHSSLFIFFSVLRQISEPFPRFVVNRGECRNKERRKTRKKMVAEKIPRNFAVSKGKTNFLTTKNRTIIIPFIKY